MIRKSLAFMLVILIVLFPIVSVGADAQKAVPLTKGEQALFDGILVPPKKMKSLLAKASEVERLKAQNDLLLSRLKGTKKIYEDELVKAIEDPGFWDKPDTQRWLGFILGIFVTGGAVWGAGQLD